MKFAAALPVLLLARLAAAQDAIAPATSQPAPGRDTPIGTCRLYDQTVADIGVDGAMKFYHCTSNAQRRYARAECEFYVALNLLIRSVTAHVNADAGAAARHTMGDTDDYSDVTVDAEGDSAGITRPGAKPMQMIRIDNQWCFSMPDWFGMQSAEDLQATRLYYENAADLLDATREQIDAGKLKTQAQIDDALQKIAATR